MARWVLGKLNSKLAKDGKGKFDVTVPEPFDFERRGKNKSKSIRERKVEEMVKEKIHNESIEINIRPKVNSIPRTTTEPLYEKILAKNEARRDEVKRMSKIITEQT